MKTYFISFVYIYDNHICSIHEIVIVPMSTKVKIVTTKTRAYFPSLLQEYILSLIFFDLFCVHLKYFFFINYQQIARNPLNSYAKLIMFIEFSYKRNFFVLRILRGHFHFWLWWIWWPLHTHYIYIYIYISRRE